MIHNCYLPQWLHRACNGVVGTLMLVWLGSRWFDEPAGTWRHVVSCCVLGASVPVGILLAVVAPRFSIVEGVAGGLGYDELLEPDDKEPLD